LYRVATDTGVNFPDPDVCHQSRWIPFVRDELGADERTVVVGHSTGALLAMRLLETQQLAGAILVSCAQRVDDVLVKQRFPWPRPLWLGFSYATAPVLVTVKFVKLRGGGWLGVAGRPIPTSATRGSARPATSTRRGIGRP
jgi:pimeloyl-ACP methyl ester carboxylesterase